MARASEAQWAKRVERFRDSGLSAKEFAAETGLNASTLSYWRWKLAAQATGKAKAARTAASTRPARARTAKPTKRAATPKFVEVPVAAVTTTPAALELWVGEVRVRVSQGFDEATLTRVVRAVEAAR